MNPELISQVQAFFNSSLVKPDSIMDAVLANSEAAGLPAIQVAPTEGILLMLLAKAIRAERILEIGTLGGYSTIWLCRALPSSGSLTTLEFEPLHAEVAKKNLALAGFSGQAEVIVGAAAESLTHLSGPFDFVFIDADKKSNPIYFEWAVKLSRPGSLIVVDNVVRDGKVAEASSDPDIEGVRQFLAMAGADPRVTVTAIQTVSNKGYDGFSLILVN